MPTTVLREVADSGARRPGGSGARIVASRGRCSEIASWAQPCFRARRRFLYRFHAASPTAAPTHMQREDSRRISTLCSASLSPSPAWARRLREHRRRLEEAGPRLSRLDQEKIVSVNKWANDRGYRRHLGEPAAQGRCGRRQERLAGIDRGADSAVGSTAMYAPRLTATSRLVQQDQCRSRAALFGAGRCERDDVVALTQHPVDQPLDHRSRRA